MNRENEHSSDKFPKMMIEQATKDRVSTPSYSDFIQTISVIFDFHGKSHNATRPKEMTESRSMLRRQTIHAEVMMNFLDLFEVQEGAREFIKMLFLKIENILSRFKSIPIYSKNSRSVGKSCFFQLVVLPQVFSVLSFLCRELNSVFVREQFRYLHAVCRNDQSEQVSIRLLKKEVSELLDDIDCADFKNWLSKIEYDSFPKMKTIERALENLRSEVAVSLNEIHVAKIILFVKSKMLAAKIAFEVFRDVNKNIYPLYFEDERPLMICHENLCERYLCNPDVDEYDFDFLDSKYFKFIIGAFKESVGHMDPDDLPARFKSAPGNLMQCEDGAFFPLVVLEKFKWDFERGRVDEDYIKHFEDAFVQTEKIYQYGVHASLIAGVLLVLKIQSKKSIPHQSLEPLIMIFMRNFPVGNELSLQCATPFGLDSANESYASRFNIAKVIYQFNSDVRQGLLVAELCNPLTGLDEILQYIFNKVDRGDLWLSDFSLPMYLQKMRPVKVFDVDLYDALKGINGLLDKFKLIELIDDESCIIRVKTSLAGDAINRYLKLTDAEKIGILKKIDPEQCAKDLAAMQ